MSSLLILMGLVFFGTSRAGAQPSLINYMVGPKEKQTVRQNKMEPVPLGTRFKLDARKPNESLMKGLFGDGRWVTIKDKHSARARVLWESRLDKRLYHIRTYSERTQPNGSKIGNLGIAAVDRRDPFKGPSGHFNGGAYYITPKGRYAYRIPDNHTTWPGLRPKGQKGNWHPNRPWSHRQRGRSIKK
jgi:hypothetical protein